jgi:hypothetical protein
MKYVLLLGLFLSHSSARSQPGFEKLYSQSGSLRLVELGSQSLLYGISGGPGGTGLTLLDGDGNIVQTTSYVQYPLLGPAGVKTYGSNGLYFITGFASGTCAGSARLFPVVGKMDSVGNISAFNHYELYQSCSSLAIGLEVTQNNDVVTWGWQYDFFALRVDSNLSHVWSKKFESNGHFQFIKELPGGDLLAGFNMDTAGAAVARLDANGNFLWCKSYMRPAGSVNDCVVESDSSFVIQGLTDNSSQTMFMMKLNGAGDVQWCRGYSSGYPWYSDYPLRMIGTNDNNYALIAINGGRPVLMKVDMNGDTLWSRSYGVSGYSYETGDLLESMDGGFLFSGIIIGDLPNMNTGLPYIFKTDSLGFLPCTPTVPPSIIISSLFPTDSSFTLISVDGATAYSGTVSGAAFNAITAYDGCVITAVPNPASLRRVQVRPNPTNGRITVQFVDPLMAESYYSVYDSMGRLLYQRPLPKGQQTEDADLSRWGKGTYVIKFTIPDGVCFERVVVE